MTLWTIAHQLSLSVEFSQQEYWSRLPFPTSGNPPDPAMEPTSPALAGRFLLPLCHLGSPHRQFRKSQILFHIFNNKIIYRFLMETEATYLENSPKMSI